MNEDKTPISLAVALISAQRDISQIKLVKDTKAYGYKYATLDQLIEKAQPVLSNHGLMQYQDASCEGDAVTVQTHILHESGERLSSQKMTVRIPEGAKNLMHTIGAMITYLRRYQLQAMLGLAAEEDRDAPDVSPAQHRAKAKLADSQYKKVAPTRGNDQREPL